MSLDLGAFLLGMVITATLGVGMIATMIYKLGERVAELEARISAHAFFCDHEIARLKESVPRELEDKASKK